MSNKIKYFNFPKFDEADWISRNPALLKGEGGFAITSAGVRMKMGPGLWNELDYLEFTFWEDTTPVVSPVGDAAGDLSGKSNREILDLILNAYQNPAFSGVMNNAGGNFANINTFEIGQTWTGSLLIQYSISNQGNLTGGTPINADDLGNIFSDEGDFAVGTITLNLTSPLTPASVTNYVVTLTATHSNGTVQVTTTIKFQPRILWGVSQNSSLTAGQWLTLTSKGSIITDTFARDYLFNASGYHWLAIPSMLSPGLPTFTDVTDPNAPAGYSMDFIAQQTINNGVGSYAYQTYRSTHNILENTSILRAA